MNSLSTCVTLATVWEATAPKPGNVYRGADFEDLTYFDLVTSAAVVGPILEQTPSQGVGATVLDAVRATQQAVGTNTNLGTLLLLAPMAAVPLSEPLETGLPTVLAALNAEDTHDVYAAIRLAHPGGMGTVSEADIHEAAPELPLVEVMALAADRDLVALQYQNRFLYVLAIAHRIELHYREGGTLGEAIVLAYLELLSGYPDSLVQRKCGEAVALEVSARATKVLASGENYPQALADFDFWLRSDGHKRNPGTSADLIAAALFVLLREDRLDWPVRFD